MWKDEARRQTPAGERRDPRPLSVRFQDAAILEYAARNRLLRGPGTPAETRGESLAPDARPAGRVSRPPWRDAAREAARAEGIYRRIAPPVQEYPLRAVALVRKLLQEGAPDEFVQEKCRMHVRYCGEYGVPAMPLIPYLAELLEVFLLDAKAARRKETARERSVP